MPKTPDDLSAFLADLGIGVETRVHPPLRTVAESQALRGEIAGAHTKNLFLRDRKGRHFLVTADEIAEIDLKGIHRLIGGAGKVSFGNAAALMGLLGVTPGAVTPFGVLNDDQHQVTMVIDAELLSNDVINCHPLTNEATTSIASADLLRFLEATGHVPLVLNLANGSPHA